MELPWLDEVMVAEHQRGPLVEGVEFKRRELLLRCGSAGKHRVAVLPENLMPPRGPLCSRP